MTNAAIAIQVLPLGAPQEKVLEIVDGVIALIASKTDHYTVSAFETTIEGNVDELTTLLNEVTKLAGKLASDDVIVNVKINYNEEGVLSTDDKLADYD